MAEPLSIVGGAASAVTFVDSALRITKELYSFINAVKGSRKQVEQHLATLQTTSTAISGLKDLLSTTSHSSSSHNVSATALHTPLQEIHKTLLAVRDLIPSDINRFPQKIKWVLTQKEFRNNMQILEAQKSTAALTLQHLHLLSQGQTQLSVQRIAADTTEAISRLQTSLIQQDSTLQSKLSSVEDISRQNLDGLSKTQQTLHTLGKSIPSDMSSKLERLSNDTNRLQISVKSSRANSTIERCSQETLHQIIEDAVKRALPSAFEEITARSQKNSGIIPGQIKEVLSQASSDLVDAIGSAANIAEHSVSSESISSGDMRERLQAVNLHKPSLSTEIDATAKATSQRILFPSNQCLHSGRRNGRLVWSSCWSSKWIGALRIEVQVRPTSRAWTPRPSGFSLKITFWPSNPLLGKFAIDMFYTNQPHGNGYYQIFPMLAVNPVIPDDSLAILYCKSGNLEKLKSLFSRGLANPNDQTSCGTSLLHYAASRGNPQMCRFLLQQGANPLWQNKPNINPK